MLKYIFNILISFDQFINVLLGPVLNKLFSCNHYGNPDETLSGTMGKRITLGKATRFEKSLCRILSWIDWTSKKHCIESIDKGEWGA